jgi:hypothetical protein
VDISAATPLSPPSSRQPLPHEVARIPQPAPTPADVNGEAPPVEAVADRLVTRVERRDDGVQQVSVVDPHTGDEITITPPDSVIHVIDMAMWQYRIRKERDRG